MEQSPLYQNETKCILYNIAETIVFSTGPFSTNFYQYAKVFQYDMSTFIYINKFNQYWWQQKTNPEVKAAVELSLKTESDK